MLGHMTTLFLGEWGLLIWGPWRGCRGICEPLELCVFSSRFSRVTSSPHRSRPTCVWKKVGSPALHLDSAERGQASGPSNLNLTLTLPRTPNPPNPTSRSWPFLAAGKGTALPAWWCGCQAGVRHSQSRPLEQL